MITKIEQLNTRYFQKVSDELEKQIRSGECESQGWHCNQYPGSWVYKIGETRVQIQMINKTGFSHEAILLNS